MRMAIRERLASRLFRFALGFERMYPQYMGFYVRRLLRRYKERGLIEDYRVRLTRKKKYHYLIELELFLWNRDGGEK